VAAARLADAGPGRETARAELVGVETRAGDAAAVDDDLVREDLVRRVAEAVRLLAAEAPLDAEVTREVPVRHHDARLDLDLRRRRVELGHQALRLLDEARQVADDDRVRALVDVDLPAR